MKRWAWHGSSESNTRGHFIICLAGVIGERTFSGMNEIGAGLGLGPRWGREQARNEIGVTASATDSGAS